MRIVALINVREVIERTLRHLGLWEQGIRACFFDPALASSWTMKALLWASLHGRVPVPLESDFLSVNLEAGNNSRHQIL